MPATAASHLLRRLTVTTLSLEEHRGARRVYLGQADPTGDLVWDVLPVDVSHSGAGDVLHEAAAHPHLWRRGRKKESAESVFCTRGGVGGRGN